MQKCLSTIYYIVISFPTEHTIGRKTIQEISKKMTNQVCKMSDANIFQRKVKLFSIIDNHEKDDNENSIADNYL